MLLFLYLFLALALALWCSSIEGFVVQNFVAIRRSTITPATYIANRNLRRQSHSPLLRVKTSPLFSSSVELPSTASFSSNPVNQVYDAEAITVLKGLEPVRKRPGMYIGSTGPKGLNHLVFEVVDNSVDEALAGYCTNIIVEFFEDGSVSVSDNGRGIPCSVHPSTGKSSLETVLCVLHAGGKFGGEESGYRVSGGLHGVGISVVNALSDSLTVEVVRENIHHSMSFARGDPVSDMRTRPAIEGEHRGTRVTFKPDSSIFKTTTVFDVEKIAERLDELAYLNAGLKISLIDHRCNTTTETSSAEIIQKQPIQKEFLHKGGIKELVSSMCQGKSPMHAEQGVIEFKQDRKGVAVEVALRWSKDMYSEALSGFANGIRTSDGGSHLDGLKQAISKTMNGFARQTGKLKEKDSNIPGDFIREGLTAVVSVKVPEPEFEGQTKTRLGNPEVRQIVDNIVSEEFHTFLEWNPSVGNEICAKAMSAQAAAQAAKAARDMVRRKSLLASSILPGKLADCSLSRDNKYETELYLVEGDSAAGSAKLGRDRNFQAILPLRGKILNIEKASHEKIYQNSEIQSLIAAIGLGIKGGEFDESALRYKKIIIMTDADVDGAHIRLLLLTFFYRYQKELIEKGYVYIACPPLFKITSVRRGRRKEEELYLYDQLAYDSYIKDMRPRMQPDYQGEDAILSNQVQRFKGLGEMMPLQLWETTMDPERRTLKKVTIEDGAQAERMFTICMGDAIDARKEFIVSNSFRLSHADLDY